MSIKVLKPIWGTKATLLERIRNTSARKVTLRSPKISNVGDKVTVLSLGSGNRIYGTFRTKTREEAERIANSDSVALKIGWDSSRNPIINAVFA